MTHNKILSISLLLMGAVFAGCSSTEDTATDNNTGTDTKKQTYLVFNNISKNPDMAEYVNSKSTRLTPTDNTLSTNGNFDYTWDKGDTLYVIKSDGSRAIIRAQSSGTTVPFTGTSSLSFTNNEALVLLTPTTNSTFSSDGKSIAFETFNNTGKITDAVKRNPLFGTTTVSSVTTADDNITVTMADATCNALFSIVCCYIKTGTDDPNFIAASIMANDTIFPTSVSLNLSNTSGTLTKGPNYLDYVRGTMNKANEYFPTLTNGSGQHLSKIYLCVVPGVALQTMKVSAFQANKAYYKKNISFSDTITFAKAKYYQVIADFTSDATEVDAYTKPGMPYSLSPGLLHAYRSSTTEKWNYEYYKDQGYMKGYAKQTPISAEYFCWGEPDPMKVTHYTFNNWDGTAAPTYSNIGTASETVKAPTSYTALPQLTSKVPGSTTDTETYTSLNYGIKALVTVNNVGYGVDPARMASGGFFRSPNTTEANYLLAGLETSGYWCVYKYNSNSVAGDTKTTWGFYLGTSDHAAASANQDNYVFVPLTGDLNYKNKSDGGTTMDKKGRFIGVKYTEGTTTTGYLYPLGTQEMFDCDLNGQKTYYDTNWETLKTGNMPFAQFSSWTCQQAGSNKANRYIFERESETKLLSECGSREIGYARAIRGVAH